jgi:hypothetical protein
MQSSPSPPKFHSNVHLLVVTIFGRTSMSMGSR